MCIVKEMTTVMDQERDGNIVRLCIPDDMCCQYNECQRWVEEQPVEACLP